MNKKFQVDEKAQEGFVQVDGRISALDAAGKSLLSLVCFIISKVLPSQ